MIRTLRNYTTTNFTTSGTMPYYKVYVVFDTGVCGTHTVGLLAHFC